jgi:hypothetical protein
MYRLLRERGFAEGNIRILADRLADPSSPYDRELRLALAAVAGQPTRAAILDGLDRLVRDANRGDFIVIYLSGHGSQQPMSTADPSSSAESDGRDDIFLPLDVGRWDSDKETVDKAIVDNEIKHYIDRLREAGAFVWIVIDACHSANMTREVVDEVYTTRAVPPDELGVPVALMQRQVSQAPSLSHGKEHQAAGRGGYVGFFAAAKDELAANGRFPLGSPERTPHGMLTFYLAQAMAKRPTASFLELSQMVSSAYREYDRDRVNEIAPYRPAATPFFEGGINQSSVLPGMVTPGWVARRTAGQDGELIISAGALHGLFDGAEVSIRTVQSNQPIGRGRLFDVRLSQARIRLEAPLDARFSGTTLIVEPPLPKIDLALRIAFAPDLEKTASADLDRVRQIVERLAHDPLRSFAVDFVAGDRNPDVILTLQDGRVWFLTERARSVEPADKAVRTAAGMVFRPSTSGGHAQTPSIPLNVDEAELIRTLREKLMLVANYRNLSKVMDMLAGAPAGKDFAIELYVMRRQRRVASASDQFPFGDCVSSSYDGVPAGAERITVGALTELEQCDRVFLILENRGSTPIDLTVLYFDADVGISVPRGFGGGMVLKPGDRPRSQPILILSWDVTTSQPLPVGVERLVVLGVLRQTREDQSYSSNFDGCAQPGLSDPLPDGRELGQCGRPRATRAAAVRGLDRLLSAASGGSTSRSATSAQTDVEDAFVIVQPWRVRPIN